MIKLNLLCVGTLKETYWKEAIKEYSKRLSRFAEFRIVEVPEKRTIKEEGREIIDKIRGYAIALDVEGDLTDSPGLAKTLGDLCTAGRSEITFIIGGSEGLDEEVKRRCDRRISFGRVTFPHQLARVIAAEQLYRAMTIINGITYHK